MDGTCIAGERVTQVAMRTGSGTGTSGLNWLLSDHLDSTAITADAGGNKVAELRYKAWQNVLEHGSR